jgi:hypothetical protein
MINVIYQGYLCKVLDIDEETYKIIFMGRIISVRKENCEVV